MATKKTVDWANYVVDEAGYDISTYTSLSAEASTLMAHASSTPEVEDIFGDVPTVAGERAEVARMLRGMALRLQALAATLDGPVVDERDSSKIGFDAAHSIG